MSEIELEGVFHFLKEQNIVPDPARAFTTRKNKKPPSEIPYSHLILFSSIECEKGVSSLCKTLSVPFFHTTDDHGKSFYIKINGVKRLVVDFIFDHQISERLEHYGLLLGSYLLMAETILTEP